VVAGLQPMGVGEDEVEIGRSCRWGGRG